jgi:mRNA-degrading endonuclease RelE of RelBE toxin-antitoxin system
MPIRRSRRFNKAFLKLPPHVQDKVLKALELLDADFRHPGLRTKRIKGSDDIFEARVDRHYRLTYERQGDVLILRNVGAHDETIDNP